MDIYEDNDFVYVDPKNRKVLGVLKWTKSGEPVSLKMEDEKESDEKSEDKRKKRRQKKKCYPWGTYRTMKKIYRLEGREKIAEEHKPFEEALSKSLKEPY